MSFWQTASTERKLAQLDAAIELGLTASQCGMNCGATGGAVAVFGRRHGRRFPADGEQAMRKKRAASAGNIQIAVNAQVRRRCEAYRTDPANSSIAKIFPEEEQSGNLFDPVPFEDGVFA